MMDHKTWLWRKKSSEKNIGADDKANNLTSKENEQVIQLLLHAVDCYILIKVQGMVFSEMIKNLVN